jgi:hypothetical protein
LRIPLKLDSQGRKRSGHFRQIKFGMDMAKRHELLAIFILLDQTPINERRNITLNCTGITAKVARKFPQPTVPSPLQHIQDTPACGEQAKECGGRLEAYEFSNVFAGIPGLDERLARLFEGGQCIGLNPDRQCPHCFSPLPDTTMRAKVIDAQACNFTV